MTRDEILAMEAGPELDALMAEKVMKWFRGRRYWQSKPGSSLLYGVGYTVPGHHDYDVRPFEASTEIVPAWKVLEKLRDERLPSIFHDGQLWVCGLSDLRNPIIASADTAPLAICHAALLAVMEAE